MVSQVYNHPAKGQPMTTATLEFGRITCPRCRGSNRVFSSESWKNITGSKPRRYTKKCDCVNGTIPDSFYSSDPSAIIAAAKPGEDVKRAWVQACRFKTSGKDGTWVEGHTVFHGTLADAVHAWCSDNGYQNLVTYPMRCSLLRCLISPNPRTIERVECPECKGTKSSGIPMGEGLSRCQYCMVNGKSTGAIPKPFDQRWRTSTVLDVARGIRGRSACVCTSPEFTFRRECAICNKPLEADPPDFSRMPILADALEDAGCDDEEIIWHLRHDACHVPSCFVLGATLGKRAAGG